MILAYCIRYKQESIDSLLFLQPTYMNKAVFIDKDGTLIPDIPYNINPDLITLNDTVIPALKLLQKDNYLLILISNQSGVARGYFTEKDLNQVSDKLTILIGQADITINGFYYCPHHTEGKIERYTIACDCRKPKPGLILRASKDFDIDIMKSWMIGDMPSDMEAGKAAGCRTILVENDETGATKKITPKADYIVRTLLEAAAIIEAS